MKFKENSAGQRRLVAVSDAHPDDLIVVEQGLHVDGHGGSSGKAEGAGRVEAPRTLQADEGPAVEPDMAAEPRVEAPLVHGRLDQVLDGQAPEGVFVVGPQPKSMVGASNWFALDVIAGSLPAWKSGSTMSPSAKRYCMKPDGRARRQAPALRHFHVIGISQVQLGEPIWARHVVRHAATETVDVAAGRPADLPCRLANAVDGAPSKPAHCWRKPALSSMQSVKPANAGFSWK